MKPIKHYQSQKQLPMIDRENQKPPTTHITKRLRALLKTKIALSSLNLQRSHTKILVSESHSTGNQEVKNVKPFLLTK